MYFFVVNGIESKSSWPDLVAIYHICITYMNQNLHQAHDIVYMTAKLNLTII